MFLLLAGLTANAADPPAGPGTASSAQSSTPEPDNVKERAKARFVRGVELVQNEDWDGALAEFLASRELFPTRVAIKNAAMCLRQLKRRAQALAMYQELVQSFGNSFSAEEKRTVEEALAQLREEVGEISITTSVTGATILVGGREQGKSPLTQPLKVDAGTHTIRIFKEGYLPFETQVTVAGKQQKQVQANLQALASSGTLVVSEAQGGQLTVVVDGVEMGKTPWTGTLAVGPHSLWLRGSGNLGTPPSAATVVSNQTTRLTLRSVHLDSHLRVEPTPSHARVDLDGVPLGQGIWEGGLGKGTHRVEVTAEGFLALRKDVVLGDHPEVLRAVLDRDLSNPLWKEAFRGFPYLEVQAGLGIAPSLGGALDDACSRGDCSDHSPALGLMVGARAGYQVARSLGLELLLGYLRLANEATRTVQATADFPVSSTDYHDKSVLAGALFALGASFRPLPQQPLLLRVSAGVLRARATFSNEGTFSGQAPRTAPLAPIAVSFPLSVPENSENLWVPFAGPEVRFGYKISPRFVLDLGVSFLLFVPPETVRRGRTPSDEQRSVRSQVAPDLTDSEGNTIRPGTTVLPREAGFGTFFCILPTLGGRWDL